MPATYESLAPNGHSTMVTRIFQKIKSWVEGQGYSTTDEKVKQEVTDTSDKNFELLFSASDDNTTHTEGSRKTQYAKINPYKKAVTFGTRDNSDTIGQYSFSSGYGNKANGLSSYAEGASTVASGTYSHAEGAGSTASGTSAHAEGWGNTSSGQDAHSEGNGNLASGDNSHAEGYYTKATFDSSHAEGSYTEATADQSHAEGDHTYAKGTQSHSEGKNTYAYGHASHAEGDNTQARGNYSHAEGFNTLAGYLTDTTHPENGQYSHAEGSVTKALGYSSHAEGSTTTASGNGSHAEGYNTRATYEYAHAEGSGAVASNTAAHAEGGGTLSNGMYSHSEGYSTSTSGYYTHAEGLGSTASNSASHAEGSYTKASSDYQHVQGKYNIEDTQGIYAHIVGNGTANNARSNAYALRWNGQQDVTNDIVRVDSGGTWDGFNASLEDAFKQNLGECNNYDAYTGIYYNFYEIAEIVVDPGTVEDNYEHQDDISNPIVMEISQIVSKNPGISDATGYSVLEIAFKFDLNTVKPEILQFLSSNSLDYFLLEDDNDSTIWHLYGRYRYITQSTPQTKNKSILHRVTGSGFHNNVTVVMENVTDSETITSIISNGTAPTRNFVKTSTSKDFVRNSAIANNYNNTETYAVGDLCFYQSSVYSNALLICNTAISTPEDFNRDHWSQVTLPGYFAKKSEAIKNITRSGTTFTATRTDDTTFTFTQQDNNTTYTFATGDSNGQIKVTPSDGSAQNVSVKGLAAAAYKGVFTRSSVGDIGWGTEANRTKVLEVNAIAFWNGRHSGTSSNLQYCDRGRFGTIVTKATGDYLPIGGGTVTGYTIFKQGIEVNKAYSSGTTTNAGGIELFGGNDAFIDFHRLYSSNDFTYRITHRGDDTMDFIGHNSSTWGKLRAAQFAVQSSIHVKENVEDITDEEANKILQLRPVSFDYSDKDRSDRKNHRGLIAEEVLEIYPEMVDVPNGYTEFNPEEPWNVPSIDYSNFVPYLIKMIQIQQNQINTLSEKLDNLNKN